MMRRSVRVHPGTGKSIVFIDELVIGTGTTTVNHQGSVATAAGMSEDVVAHAIGVLTRYELHLASLLHLSNCEEYYKCI